MMWIYFGKTWIKLAYLFTLKKVEILWLRVKDAFTEMLT